MPPFVECNLITDGEAGDGGDGGGGDGDGEAGDRGDKDGEAAGGEAGDGKAGGGGKEDGDEDEEVDDNEVPKRRYTVGSMYQCHCLNSSLFLDRDVSKQVRCLAVGVWNTTLPACTGG